MTASAECAATPEAATVSPSRAHGDLAIRAERVSHTFGEGVSRSQVLFDNCLAVGSGEFVILTGPSGSGKTTLLTLIGALRRVQAGRVDVLGHDLSATASADLVAVRRKIGFIFQMHNLFESLSAYENVKLAMQLAGTAPAKMRREGTALLERLGLGGRIDDKPKALSGGQRQRVAIARALVNRPPLVLADEPTAALDKDASRTLMDVLQELVTEHGSTVVMVTHDARLVEAADRVVTMLDGRIVADRWCGRRRLRPMATPPRPERI
jgi:putative ABC transport system ATP-binding protein